MRHILLLAAGIFWLGWVSGCSGAKKGVLSDLPDPVLGTVRAEPTLPPTIVERPSRPEPTVPSPMDWIPRGGISPRWSCIVIHHSASQTGGAEAFDRYHRNVRKWNELGYHFVIGNGTDTRDGEIEVGSRWIKQKHGAHCKTSDNHYNEHGIGICLVGNFNDHPPTQAQMTSLARLVAFLTRECGIGASRVYTHQGVTHCTECPGACFSLAALKSRVGTEVTAVSHSP
ncbi:MAG: peptidoglycan recognition family protein [Acidobacteriota bacterium]